MKWRRTGNERKTKTENYSNKIKRKYKWRLEYHKSYSWITYEALQPSYNRSFMYYVPIWTGYGLHWYFLHMEFHFAIDLNHIDSIGEFHISFAFNSFPVIFFCYSFPSAHIYEWMNGEWALVVSRKKMKQDIKTLPIRIFRTETRSTYIHTRDRIISKMFNTELGKYICEMSVWWENRADENKK